MGVHSQTKKEHIVSLASKDPFLKVEEIARTVKTTPRYVRTILSESKMSLMRLRRSYARNMERRLGVNVTVPKSGTGLTGALAEAGNVVGVNHVRILKTVSPEFAKLLGVSPDEQLLQVLRVRMVNNVPFFVNEVVTNRILTVGEDMVSSDKPLRQLLGLELQGETEFVDRSLEVEPADEFVAVNLGLKVGSPILKSGNVIVTRDERVGLEFNIFDAYRVKFILTGVPEYSLQLVEKL